jgi:hypothetical protein
MTKQALSSKLLGAHVVAAIVAALAALALAESSALGVSAANHCTRYAPVVTQDYLCYTYGELSQSGDWGYQTPSVALRDVNGFSNESSSNWYELGYIGGNNLEVGWIQGYGSTIGSSQGYAKAKCGTLYPTIGVCYTEWHD